MQHRLLGWAITGFIIGGSLVAYTATALLSGLATDDAVAGAAIAAIVAAVMALIYRRVTTGGYRPQLIPVASPARSEWFWVLALAGLIASWLLGQTLAQQFYETWGSDQYDQMTTSKLDSPAWLLVITTLILAPIGEESLMRGVIYPALRVRLPVMVSALVTALLFAVMHGNPVQIVLTVPLGIVLALVYEATQRLWPVIVMHMVFNMIASIVPTKALVALSSWPLITLYATATAIVCRMMLPGRSLSSAGDGDRPAQKNDPVRGAKIGS